MLIERTDLTFPTPGLPNAFPYPLQLGANTVGWWSAEQLVTLQGNSVTQWQDLTKYGLRVNSASSPNPILIYPGIQNGLPGIGTGQTVGGSTAWLRSNGPSIGLDQMEWNAGPSVAAGRFVFPTSEISTHIPLGYSGQAAAFPGWGWFSRNTSTNIWNMSIYQANPLLSIGMQTSNPMVLQPGQTGTVIWTYDGSGVVAGMSLYVNGAFNSVGSGGSSQLVSSLLGANRCMQMFTLTPSSPSPDILFEVVMCLGSFQQQQVTLMDNYLNTKWALHPAATL